MNILLVLLGCNIQYLLNDRIEAAINRIHNITYMSDNMNVTWFLSGGIKNKDESAISEAEYMGNLIQEKLFKDGMSSSDHQFIYDTLSTNTAENFMALNGYISDKNYQKMFIITSKFHKKRANLFLDKIIPGTTNHFEWILSELKQSDSHYWENIHIRNVDADIQKASRKIKLNDIINNQQKKEV